MLRMSCGLLDQMKQDSSNRATFGVGKPRCIRKRYATPHIVNTPKNDIRACARFFVRFEDASQRLILGQ